MTNNFLVNYFGFNRQQRNGLVVLLFLCFLLLLARLAYPGFIKPDKITVKNLPLLEMQIDRSQAKTEKRHAFNDLPEEKSTLFVFNPNTVTVSQLSSLGLSEKTAKRFIKFRNKGFVFKAKKDLLKVYGISEKMYLKLEPYILVEEQKTESPVAVNNIKQNQEPKEKPLKETKQVTKLELNTADSLTLIAINGIGPSYAKRILKYRSMLGGYVSLEQLKEVYGFTEDVYKELSPNFTVNPLLVKKINLAKDDFKSINKHPYISYELTKSLLDWRRKTELNTTNLKDIINDDILYNKLLPYLKFD